MTTVSGLEIFFCSLITILLTSIVPIVIFLLVGPLLVNSQYQSFILTILVSLGAGSLLGDVFFHLIPEIFNLPTTSLRYGVAMLIGIFIFFLGERLLTHYHPGHGHEHLEGTSSISRVLFSPQSYSRTASEDERNEGENIETVELTNINTVAPTILPVGELEGRKPVGLLVLTSDFIHNFVDGIAIGASYATSFSVGFSTSMAVFFHEIPHELGDFAILLNCGYQPPTIVMCNILTSTSSLVGVLTSMAILQSNSVSPISGEDGSGVFYFATTLKPIILAFTAGNFLYIALADLVPELLQTLRTDSMNLTRSTIHSLIQYLAFIIGALIMLLIKLYGD